MQDLESISRFLLAKGFVFPTAEIYGSLKGFYDYGPLGVELKNAIKQEWWKHFVHEKGFILGIDGSIITHPKVWEASGHVDEFHDPLVECKKCKARFRADKLIEDLLGIPADGLSLEQINQIIKENNLKCPKCKGELSEARYFNLMFSTQVGPVEGNIAYLRPETAQLIFVNFKRVYKTSRAKLPFGIAQIGKAFRNEISPRNFLFRLREFEQMEIEFFFDPEDEEIPEEVHKAKEAKLPLLTRERQEDKSYEVEEMRLSEVFGDEPYEIWHAYWLKESFEFLVRIGLSPDKLRFRQHLKEELSHYSKDTWDIEFEYPFGWKEIVGIANRTDFDLGRHAKYSGEDLTVQTKSGKKIIPWVIEPSFGLDRIFLAVISNGYIKEDRELLRLKPRIAPVQVAVFPLVAKDSLDEIAKEIYMRLRKKFRAFYDDRGSIGRRYRRQDSIGTPFCITVDYQTKEDATVTIRDRDSMAQQRVKIDELERFIEQHL